jgi:hypothetical protein
MDELSTPNEQPRFEMQNEAWGRIAERILQEQRKKRKRKPMPPKR